MPALVRDSSGIELVVVHSTEQHVDGLQAVERTQPQPTLAHHQVGALDEVVAEVRRQVGVLDVAGERRPRREQDAAADCADRPGAQASRARRRATKCWSIGATPARRSASGSSRPATPRDEQRGAETGRRRR